MSTKSPKVCYAQESENPLIVLLQNDADICIRRNVVRSKLYGPSCLSVNGQVVYTYRFDILFNIQSNAAMDKMWVSPPRYGESLNMDIIESADVMFLNTKYRHAILVSETYEHENYNSETELISMISRIVEEFHASRK